MAAKVNEELCTGCGACVEVCPVEAISLSNGKAQIEGDKCVDCGVCVGECPTDAISLE
jgi:Fe-S-cluster-containing hydrogenase component 2